MWFTFPAALFHTGKRCDDPNCDGYLEDTIINFGESLPTGRQAPPFLDLPHFNPL